MRAFVAIDLAAEMKRPLLQLLRSFPRGQGVRWCTENQLHITLKFLGDVNDLQLPRVCEAIDRVAHGLPPFPIRLSGLGAFPPRGGPRVLWAGILDETESGRRWVRDADPLLAELGFDPERRAFTPHVTLGRSKSREGSALIRSILEQEAPAFETAMTVNELILFESRLSPRGAQYVPAHRARLGS